MTTASSSRKTARGLVCGAALATTLGLAVTAGATPGTHPPLVSTWNATASSISGAFTAGAFNEGHLDFGSLTSNWSSTSGNFSAQFGAHYVNYLARGEATAMHGGAGTAAFVFSAPTLSRHATGLPRAAIGLYVGSAPTVLIGGEHNHLWLPLAAGLALPLSPLRFVSITPWFEAAGGATFDAVIKAPDVKEVIGKMVGRAAATPGRLPTVTQRDLDALLAQAIRYDISGALTLRGGLSLAVHILDVGELGLGVSFGNVGKLGGGGDIAVFTGASLSLRWDATVPAVLPPRARLDQEACADVRERAMSCPVGR